MRLLSGLIASRPIGATLVGDASLSRRPMKRIADPLRRMGAVVMGDQPPLHIVGAQLQAIEHESDVASAQVKSCILLAALRAKGITRVAEPSKSRDHTERMLRATGVRLVEDKLSVALEGGQTPHAFEIGVPADISSAAFFVVAAAVLPESVLMIRDLGINPTRAGLLDVLDQVGVPYALGPVREELGEPVADVEIRAARELRPFRIAGELVPRLIDEIPVLAVLATQCQGTSEIRDARELRVKESDRIETVAAGLRSMGAVVETFEDGMAVVGPTRLTAKRVDAQGDHRIAMAFSIAGLLAEGTTVVDGAEAIATSYPGFETDLMRLCVV